MKVTDLKKVRVAASLLFLIPAIAVFLDFANVIPPEVTTGLFALQFLPSFTRCLHLISFAALGLAIVLVLTGLFGRAYCSSICPLGTLQDIISRISRTVHRTSGYVEQPQYSLLRYTLLGLTLLSLITGAMAVVSLLDPFSNFGRILAGLARPIAVGINNSAALALESLGLFVVYPLQMRGVGMLSLIPPLLLLALVAWLSWTRGRMYCNTVCPVGTLLGLLSRVSAWRVAIDASECTGCGLCEPVCKAGCIDTARKTIDMSRCVICCNCFAECPTGGIQYVRASRAGTAQPELDPGKRNFVLNSLAAMTSLLGLNLGTVRKAITVTKDSTVPVTRLLPVAPPGAGTIGHFTENCTACHLCISACPTRVLAPAFLEYGVQGLLQPRMDYATSFCNFECVLCSTVCPTGALQAVKVEQKKLAQLGAAKFVKDNCIVYTETTECGACSEHCPTKAVKMVPYKHLMAPEVTSDYCIGCGACEFACPTKPWKAIYVEGNAQHTIAKVAPSQKPEAKPGEDFPF